MRASIITLAVLILIVSSFLGCKDQERIDTLSSPQMAGGVVDYQVKLISKDGDGPLVERMVNPVIWDGVSELKSGVVYHWNSFEEALAAYKDRRPEKYRVIKEWAESIKNSMSENKSKSMDSNLLAFSPSVWADVHPAGGGIFAQCVVDEPSESADPCFSWHWLGIAVPFNLIDEKDTTYYDCQAHYNHLEQYRNCPTDLNATCHLYHTLGNWWDEDADGCE